MFTHLKYSALNGQDGDVESSASQVVNQNVSLPIRLNRKEKQTLQFQFCFIRIWIKSKNNITQALNLSYTYVYKQVLL